MSQFRLNSILLITALCSCQTSHKEKRPNHDFMPLDKQSSITLSLASFDQTEVPHIETQNLEEDFYILYKVCFLETNTCTNDISQGESIYLKLPQKGKYEISTYKCNLSSESEDDCKKLTSMDFEQKIIFHESITYSEDLWLQTIRDESFKIFANSKKQLNHWEHCANHNDDPDVKEQITTLRQLVDVGAIGLYDAFKTEFLPLTQVYFSKSESQGLSLFKGKTSGVAKEFSEITPYKVTLYNRYSKTPAHMKGAKVLSKLMGDDVVNGHSAIAITNSKHELVRYTSWPSRDSIVQDLEKSANSKQFSFYISETKLLEYNRWLKKQEFYFDSFDPKQGAWDGMKSSFEKIMISIDAKKGSPRYKKMRGDVLDFLKNNSGEEFISSSAANTPFKMHGIDLSDTTVKTIDAEMRTYAIEIGKYNKLNRVLTADEKSILANQIDTDAINLSKLLGVDDSLLKIDGQLPVKERDMARVEKMRDWIELHDRDGEFQKYPSLWLNSPNGIRFQNLINEKELLAKRIQEELPMTAIQFNAIKDEGKGLSIDHQVIKDIALKEKLPEAIIVKKYQKKFDEIVAKLNESDLEYARIDSLRTKFSSTYQNFRRDIALHRNSQTKYGQNFDITGRKGLACIDVATACVRQLVEDDSFYPRWILPRNPQKGLKNVQKYVGDKSSRKGLTTLAIVGTVFGVVGVEAFLLDKYLNSSEDDSSSLDKDITQTEPKAKTSSDSVKQLQLTESAECSANPIQVMDEINASIDTLNKIAAERVKLHMAFLDSNESETMVGE